MDSILPLQPASEFTLNTQSPSSASVITMKRPSSSSSIFEDDALDGTAPSSPLILRSPEEKTDFIRKLSPCPSNDLDVENVLPPRKSSIASSATSTGTSDANSVENGSRSPLKPLRSRTARSPNRDSMNPNVRAARRQSVNRFPVKINVSRPISPPIIEEVMTPDETDSNDLSSTLRNDVEGDDVVRADSVIESGIRNGCDRTPDEDVEDEDFADMTAYSQFSAVPDMTMFAKLGKSPLKSLALSQAAITSTTMSSNNIKSQPEIDDKIATPTKTRTREAIDGAAYGNTTNLIIDFTQQFDQLQRPRMSPSKTAPSLQSYAKDARTPSPNKHRQVPPNARMSHLLDFDIPPAPTPRSVPTITPRELETLKSNFLSEISSLKSSLMGSQAEVQFLKTAVSDAENRVGTCMEQIRENSSSRADWEAEKENWENRGREMEEVLRNVQEEIGNVEEERERLEGRLQESEMKREAAESMAQEAESKMAGMRAASAVLSHSADPDKKSTSSSREVEMQVEKVARELHTLYKGKHEAKVAALKKSYESKWDKKIRQLETQLEASNRENEHLRNGKDATMNRVTDPVDTAKEDERVRELEARLEKMSEEMRHVQTAAEVVRQELERERQEKGELVIACDELLALQSTEPAPKSEAFSASVRLPPTSSKHMAASSSPKRPVSTIGLPRPSSSSSNGEAPRLGMPKARPVSMMRAPGAYSGAPGTPLASRIGKMGTYKGRGLE